MTTTRLCVTVALCALCFISCARGWTWPERGDDRAQGVSCQDGTGGGGDGMFDDCADPMDEDPVEVPDAGTTTTVPTVAGCGS